MFEKIEKFVSCACVSIMAVLVFSNVIARFLFKHSLAVSDEMSTYLFVLMSFMGTAIAARRRAHLGLSIITDHVSPHTRLIIQDYLSSFYIFYGNGEKCWYGTQDKYSDFVYSQEVKNMLAQYQANASQGKSWSTVRSGETISLFVCYKKGGVAVIGVWRTDREKHRDQGTGLHGAERGRFKREKTGRADPAFE